MLPGPTLGALVSVLLPQAALFRCIKTQQPTFMSVRLRCRKIHAAFHSR